MKTAKTVLSFLVVACAACSYADDAVGVVRVDAAANGLPTVQMPFAPLEDSGPLGYISGGFLGNGDDLSDRLIRLDSATGAITNAVWSEGAWLDPATGLPSFMSAWPGDTLCIWRGDNDPFSFFLFGRVYGVAAHGGSPQIRSIGLDPEGDCANLSVFTRGLTTDLFMSDFSSNALDAASWVYCGRRPGYPLLCSLHDAGLPSSGGRVYLAADATRDADADGLPDELEHRVYGTSIYLSDTDGDGVPDGEEVAWGSDPLVPDCGPRLSLFREPFESPEVVNGPLAGQNGWTGTGSPANASVQGEIVYEGAGALELCGGNVAHSVTCSSDVVWMDLWEHLDSGICNDFAPGEGTLFFSFDLEGHPIMSDGDAVVTNAARTVRGWRSWTRCTAMLDYASRTWDFYVDGAIVGEGLSMRGQTPRMREFVMSGTGVADDVRITTSRPEGLSSDGDELPDEWELAHFGDLSHDGSIDSDGDGMTDLVEFGAGTDPLAPNMDSDGDGLPDWWETANGLNPLGSNDLSHAVFHETFEAPSVNVGDIRGQNGWSASRDGAGEVRRGVVHSGEAALAVRGGSAEDGDSVSLSHASASNAEVVWMDVWQIAARMCEWADIPPEVFAAYKFDREGHPVLSDGNGFITNRTVRVEDEERWARCTCRFDFPNRKWDFYLDGMLVASGLAMRGTTGSIHALEIAGGSGHLDDIYIGEARPEGLSSDGDGLPDEWEFRNLGGLSRDGSGDLDGDGLSDLEEFHSGSNPARTDTDGDGMPDAWEVANGFVPSDSSDALLDADGDGYPNYAEFVAGTDPHSVDRFLLLGYVPGLNVAYYSFARNITSMPDFHRLSPVSECTWDIVDQPSTNAPWASAPDGLSDRFGVVIEGALLVPESGFYKLTLSSDDGSCLWVDGVKMIDHGKTHSMSSKSATVPLSEGLHDLAIEYFENNGSAGLRLLWSKDGAANSVVPADCLFHASDEVPIDSDGDGMPDWWEWRYALDPSDPSDAALDADDDGLSNLAEFRAGADPHSQDTDSDEMPDAWELANGLCPFVDDSILDADGDGLVNIEEFRIGTDLRLVDTDGDGASDFMEVRNSRGDPLVADIEWVPSSVGTNALGASFVDSTGTWRTDLDGTAFAAERAGSLTWNLAVPEGGADALAVRIGQHNAFAKLFSFDLSLKVDGIFVSRTVVSAPFGTSEDAYFFLPEIPAGEHEFRVTWHNWEVNTFLAVYDLRFVNFGGPDADGDGVVDWKKHRADESYALDALPFESLVSPICIEGRDLWRDVLEVEVEYPDTNAVFATVKTIGDGFYADIPLTTNGAAVVSMRDRSLVDSFPVAWKPFDVFVEDYATNALVIRTGDSLLVAPRDGDEQSEVTISVAEGTNKWVAITNWTASTAVPYEFTEHGIYLVEVVHHGLLADESAYALVEVVRSRFPKRNPAILQDARQVLSCPELSPRNILEHDVDLQLEAEPVGGGVALSLLTHADRDLGLVSRLSEDGAVSDAVQLTPVWSDNGTYCRVAGTYPDGSQLVAVSLLLGAVPEGTTVKLSIFVSGVTFEDGTRSKTLAAEDFDEDGHVTIHFIRARGVKTSVCHSTRIYQDGKLIYKNR